MAYEYLTWVYLGIGILIFIFGFLLVYGNLQKINLIEGEKFVWEDWVSCTGFGLMFSLAIVFMVNIIADVLLVNETESHPSYAGIILIILLIILVVYPLWEVIFLGKPTSDAVHDFHKLLETKILDKFKGNVAYLVSFLIFVVLYIVPIVIIYSMSSFSIGAISFVWFLIFPLFFLNYFAAAGQMSTILGKYYQSEHYINKKQERYLFAEDKAPVNKIIKIVIIIITWIPFLLAFYNIYKPISAAVAGNVIDDTGKGATAAISLFTTVVFGIKGFFNKFWSKKSKTKIIDFIFSGYIFIGIGVNMLINFFTINPAVVSKIMGVEIFGVQPLVAMGVDQIFSQDIILIPVIVMQSLIMVVYGGYLYLNKVSNFQADTRLAAVNSAYGSLDIDKIIKGELELNLDKVKREMAEEESGAGNKKKRGKKSKLTYDLQTLIKSILLPPMFNKYGVDLNETVRFKSSQYLLLICSENRENKEYVNKIIEKLLENTIETPDVSTQIFISKEAVDLLGYIGTISEYTDLILNRLINAIPTVSTQLKLYILDALGDVGESREHIEKVLEALKPLLVDEKYELRHGAGLSITEMILEGETENEDFVNIALSPLYDILENYSEDENLVETALETLLSTCTKVAKFINFDKILPFIQIKEDGKDPIVVEYALQNAIAIIASTVYYNLDKFPKYDIMKFLDDPRENIRYVASDALGNYVLKRKDDEIINRLLRMSIYDTDPDVSELCIESITEFLIMNKDYKTDIMGESVSILEYYRKNLETQSGVYLENTSEALKSISSLYKGDIVSVLQQGIKNENLEVVRDCLHALSGLSEEVIPEIDLKLLYEKCQHEDSSVRAEALFALGSISLHREDIDESIVIKRLEDEDPNVRLEAIFALGKIGIKQPDNILPALIEKFITLDVENDSQIAEFELYAESLGIIGAKYPKNEIVIVLQQALMGDVNPFAKDVVVRALNNIGMGLIESGKATSRIESEAFANVDSQIQNLFITGKKEFTVGNIMIMMIEALQMKGIPESVMNEISDAMQDLLPVFTFVKNEKKKNEILNTLKVLLAQAYYSNYNNEILETIDRIDSLISFRAYFEAENISDALRERLLFYAKQYTPDGKQFHDQGEVFLLLEKQDPAFLDYALKSFEIAVELAPNEYFTPNCIFNMALIEEKKGDKTKALQLFESAMEIYSSLDEVAMMKECETHISALK